MLILFETSICININICMVWFTVFSRTVHRRDGAATAQRGSPDGNNEHEAGSGAQVPSGVGSETRELRGVHALRSLSWRPVARRRPAQPQSREFVFGPVLRRGWPLDNP